MRLFGGSVPHQAVMTEKLAIMAEKLQAHLTEALHGAVHRPRATHQAPCTSQHHVWLAIRCWQGVGAPLYGLFPLKWA